MADILEFPEKDDFEFRLQEAYTMALDEAMDEFEDQTDEIKELVIDSIVFTGAFGKGRGEKGTDRFQVIIFIDKSGEGDPSDILFFSRIARNIEDETLNNFEPSELIMEWSGGINIRVVSVENFDGLVSSAITDIDEDRVFDIYNNRICELEPQEPVGTEVVCQSLREYLGEEDVIEEGEEEGELTEQEREILEQAGVIEEEVEPEEEVPIIPSEAVRERRLAEKFPGIPLELRKFATAPDELEIPAGKETKAVEPRQMYDFERELLTPGEGETELDVGEEGIGFAMASGQFGTGRSVPGTFPRTSTYVKWYLRERGPAYILEMYKDLVVYSGFIRGIHGVNIKPGTYQSFREFMFRLQEINERGGPRLIISLSQQQAASRGLETTADHPSIPGEKAPWLEHRRYFEIEMENFDHPAWRNPVKYLYDVLPEAEGQ